MMTAEQIQGTRAVLGDPEADVPPWHPSQPHHELAADVRWWMGTPIAFGLFGQLALDQVAYREVAAAVDASGRFAENFTDRGLRSYLWSGPLLFGDDADRHAKAESLKALHAQVKGVGKGDFEGERFSALDPKLWKWVGATSLNIFYAGYLVTYGQQFTSEQREVVYRTIRWLADFSLPSAQADLPSTAEGLTAYYDEVAATKLEANPFLLWAAATFQAVPVPTLVGPRWAQLLITPVWRLLTPVVLRPARICAEAATHPRMREILGRDWTPRKQVEFRIYRALIRMLRRRLPKRMMLEPMAYNRYRYERLQAGHAQFELSSFAIEPPSSTGR